MKRKPLTKIQKFARGKPCSLRIPGVCRPAPDNETTVLAHAPYSGRHGSRRDDFWGCPSCFECHQFMDIDAMNESEREYRMGMWMPAIHEWQEMLIKAGLIIVKEKP